MVSPHLYVNDWGVGPYTNSYIYRLNHHIRRRFEFEFVTNAAVRQLDLLWWVAAEVRPSSPQALRLRKSDAER